MGSSPRPWLRGALALGLLAAVVTATLVAPVNAVIKKKTVKKVASQLDRMVAPRLAFARDDDLQFETTEANDDAGLLSTQIVAPADGFLAIDAGADVSLNAFATYQWATLTGCGIKLDGTLLGSTHRRIALSSEDQSVDDQANYEEDCTTEGAVAVKKGTHSVDFRAMNINDGAIYSSAVLWVMWVPFDGNGDPPSAFTLGRG